MATRKTVAEVPTTGRTPAFLAKRYGFASLNDFIASIPKQATVVDVGAGMSLLGHAVTRVRKDVNWINVDPYYSSHTATAAIARLPKKVRYVAEDITNPGSELRNLRGRATRVYSYWMLPHLSLVSPAPAERAVAAMWDLLAPDGQMVLGPDDPYRVHALLRAKRSLVFHKKTPCAAVSAIVVSVTRLPLWMRVVQDFINRRLTPLVRPTVRIFSRLQMKRARRSI